MHFRKCWCKSYCCVLNCKDMSDNMKRASTPDRLSDIRWKPHSCFREVRVCPYFLCERCPAPVYYKADLVPCIDDVKLNERIFKIVKEEMKGIGYMIIVDHPAEEPYSQYE